MSRHRDDDAFNKDEDNFNRKTNEPAKPANPKDPAHLKAATPPVNYTATPPGAQNKTPPHQIGDAITIVNKGHPGHAMITAVHDNGTVDVILLDGKVITQVAPVDQKQELGWEAKEGEKPKRDPGWKRSDKEPADDSKF